MKFLKTYGKQKTRLSGWVAIQDRKQAFDSTSASQSSETDISTHQASKPARIRNTRNAAKKKAPLQLTSDDEDNIFTQPQPPSRRRKPSTAHLVCARKRKLPSLSVSSDEENVLPPPQKTRAANYKKLRKKSRIHSNKTTSDKILDHCSDENMCPPVQKSSSLRGRATTANGSIIQEQTVRKTLQNKSVCLRSAGRFVTRRRNAISSSPRRLLLNSSEEFSSSRIICPSKRRCPPVFLESSTDSSVAAAVLSSFVTIPLRDISLNESVEYSHKPCSKKPIFCSTPSAAPLAKSLKDRHFNPAFSPPSISLSCIGPVSTFQADYGSPEQLTSPPHASPSEISVEKKADISVLQKHSQPREELYDCVFTALSKSPHNTTSSGGGAHSRCEEGPTPASHEMPSAITIGSDISSYFTSATGELDWLNDVLKEKCLTQLCTVRLERIEDLIKLFSETTYSSCLGDSGSGYSSNAKDCHIETLEPSTGPDRSVSSDILKSVKGSKSSVQQIALVTDSQCTEPPKSNNCKEFEHKSSSDLFSESPNICDDIADVQIHNETDELSTIIKNKCLSRECSVQLKKLLQSSIELHLKPEPNQSENDQSKARLSQKISTTVCQSPPDESQKENKADLIKDLKENCLDSKPLVKVTQMSITKIKHKLQENIIVSNRDISELVSEQTESETNCSTTSPRETSLGRRRKKTSASSNDRNVSDKDVLKTSSNRHGYNRKKKSLAPKEKKQRISTHRSGTTRKACVSGLSMSRWKSKDAFISGIARRGGMKAVDCSINELIPSQQRQHVELTDFSKNFSTPVKSNHLSISSVLTELTPSTHTWSRLKAALSIHRKVIVTPKTPGLQQSSKMALEDLSLDLFATPFRTPLSKSLRTQLMTHESQLIFDDNELSDAEKVYAECSQQGPLSWNECILPQRMKRCVKIGEGTFGEVFSTTSGKSDEETVALKVIPVEGSDKVNGEEQKTFGEILHEIIISKELSCLKEKKNNQTCGFIGLRDLHCVKGCYPPEFLKAWDKFDKQKCSENDRPDFFENEQLFIILEFEFGGTDLENCNGTLPSIIVAKSILHQVTAALAVAEQELHFEHRDLHWGNVLVKKTKQKTTEFCLNGTVFSLETKGILVRIIDYSLSRLEIDELMVSCDISHDEELFMGQGDYQFDIYRLMRQENGNDWSGYNPHSNVLWLHYLCSKLLDMKYRGARGRGNKDMRGELTSFYDNVLQFSSATEVLQNSPLFILE